MRNVNAEYPYDLESAVLNVKFFTKCYLDISKCHMYSTRHASVIKQASLVISSIIVLEIVQDSCFCLFVNLLLRWKKQYRLKDLSKLILIEINVSYSQFNNLQELEEAFKENSLLWVETITSHFRCGSDSPYRDMVTKLKDMANAVRVYFHLSF